MRWQSSNGWVLHQRVTYCRWLVAAAPSRFVALNAIVTFSVGSSVALKSRLPRPSSTTGSVGPSIPEPRDRKSVVLGKSVSVSGDLGGSSMRKKKTTNEDRQTEKKNRNEHTVTKD